MNKQLMQSGRWKTDSPISDEEQDAAEQGKSPADLKAKAKKQIEEKEKWIQKTGVSAKFINAFLTPC